MIIKKEPKSFCIFFLKTDKVQEKIEKVRNFLNTKTNTKTVVQLLDHIIKTNDL